jgi:hypothetical protein
MNSERINRVRLPGAIIFVRYICIAQYGAMLASDRPECRPSSALAHAFIQHLYKLRKNFRSQEQPQIFIRP